MGNNKRSDTAAGNKLITLKYTIMAKTLKQLSEQQERFNKLWKYTSKGTKELAKKVWRMKYKEVHSLCDCGQYSTNTPGGFFPDYAAHYAAKINGGKVPEYYKGFRLNKIASDIFNQVAIF